MNSIAAVAIHTAEVHGHQVCGSFWGLRGAWSVMQLLRNIRKVRDMIALIL